MTEVKNRPDSSRERKQREVTEEILLCKEDYYQVLDVSRSASTKDIEKAFRLVRCLAFLLSSQSDFICHRKCFLFTLTETHTHKPTNPFLVRVTHSNLN